MDQAFSLLFPLPHLIVLHHLRGEREGLETRLIAACIPFNTPQWREACVTCWVELVEWKESWTHVIMFLIRRTRDGREPGMKVLGGITCIFAFAKIFMGAMTLLLC